MRPYVAANQELGIRSGNYLGHKKKRPFILVNWKDDEALPGHLVEFFINRTTSV